MNAFSLQMPKIQTNDQHELQEKIQQNIVFENIYMFYFVSNEGDDVQLRLPGHSLIWLKYSLCKEGNKGEMVGNRETETEREPCEYRMESVLN